MVCKPWTLLFAKLNTRSKLLRFIKDFVAFISFVNDGMHMTTDFFHILWNKMLPELENFSKGNFLLAMLLWSFWSKPIQIQKHCIIFFFFLQRYQYLQSDLKIGLDWLVLHCFPPIKTSIHFGGWRSPDSLEKLQNVDQCMILSACEHSSTLTDNGSLCFC